MDTTALSKINEKDRLYVIDCGHGYTCLGFDVCERKAAALALEMNIPRTFPKVGTAEAYAEYVALVEEARKRYEATGRRSAAELTPQLVGLEGKRVEVVDCYGERRRFKVGKSTGWIPCHLELANIRSTGGSAVTGAPFKSVRTV